MKTVSKKFFIDVSNDVNGVSEEFGANHSLDITYSSDLNIIRAKRSDKIAFLMKGDLACDEFAAPTKREVGTPLPYFEGISKTDSYDDEWVIGKNINLQHSISQAPCVPNRRYHDTTKSVDSQASTPITQHESCVEYKRNISGEIMVIFCGYISLLVMLYFYADFVV